MEHRFGSRDIDFEDHAIVGSAALIGGAVEVARGVPKQAGVGQGTIRGTDEVM